MQNAVYRSFIRMEKEDEIREKKEKEKEDREKKRMERIDKKNSVNDTYNWEEYNEMSNFYKVKNPVRL